ncbi:MAG: DUF4147 domain-containing protein [Planctomycetia bacterium]|nr:DUF4147 domain-containing protein [Planctomycetia bacterium]
MNSPPLQQLQDAITIWQSGVDAVNPLKLILNSVFLNETKSYYEIKIQSLLRNAKSNCLEFYQSIENAPEERNQKEFTQSSLLRDYSVIEPLFPNRRIIVVGMGKASAQMALGIETVLKHLVDLGRLSGWVNIPDDPILFKTPLRSIHLHGARPPQYNEPTEQGVYGSQKIIELIRSAQKDDLIFCLISGGGSALLPLTIPEITLQEKIAITRFLSAAGANITELNVVRKELSLLKGGGIRTLCRNKRLISLILSDVLGDPLDIIASGPTVENQSTPFDALKILQKFGVQNEKTLTNIYAVIKTKAQNCSKVRNLDHQCFGDHSSEKVLADQLSQQKIPLNNQKENDCYSRHYNIIIGNNQTAVLMAAQKAKELGYRPYFHSATKCEGNAETVGQKLLSDSLKLFRQKHFSQETKLFSENESSRAILHSSNNYSFPNANSFKDYNKEKMEPKADLCPFFINDKRSSDIDTEDSINISTNKNDDKLNFLETFPFDCVISGGEPVVQLVTEDKRGKGGRNQQLVLAALINLLKSNEMTVPVFLSAGTDGEDGPTNAAGAFFDRTIFEKIQIAISENQLSPSAFLEQNNAWVFFQMFEALFQTGATGTNVCDLRIVLKEKSSE